MNKYNSSPAECVFSSTPERDIERGRVQEFEQIINNIAGSALVQTELDFKDRVPVKSAVDRFMTYEFTGKSELYIDSSLRHLGEVAVAQFMPRVARAGKNSAHGVFFGDLVFENDNVLSVAVKPYMQVAARGQKDAVNASLIDYFNGVAVNKLGLYSLQPAGCLLDASERAYTLTILDEVLTTLDSIDWSSFYPDLYGNPGMLQMWSQIARQVGMLHSAGAMSHGDLAGRNIAVTADSYAFLIDWEKSHISTVQPRDAEVRYEFSHPDLATLLESMCRPTNDDFKAGLGIFYGKEGTVEEWWNGFKQMFFDEYLSTRQEIVETTNDEKLIAEVTDELKVLSASLLNDMKMQHGICRQIQQARQQRA